MNDSVVRLALVMPSSSGSERAGFLALHDRFLVHLAELDAIDVLALEEVGLAGVGDPHLLQHLAHDHADVLVVDLHALEPVDLLDLVQEVLLHRARALDAQDVVRVDRALGEAVTGPHLVALVDAHVLPDRHLVRPRRALLRRDVHLALAALDVAEADDAVDLGDDRRILGTPRLEQLGHPGQTAGDVAGLVDLAADLRERVARRDLVAVVHGELRAHRDDELLQLLGLLRVLPDLDRRVELLVAVLDDRHLATARGLVQLLAHRHLLDDVLELDDALGVRHDGLRVGVPAEEQVARLDLLALLDRQRRRRTAPTAGCGSGLPSS